MVPFDSVNAISYQCFMLSRSLHCYRDYCRQSSKLHIFPYPTGLSQQNSGSQDITIRVGFSMPASRTPTYLSCAHFHFCCATTARTDRQTDRRLLVAYRDNCYTPFACINMMYDGLLGYCQTNRCPEMTLLQTRRHL